MLRGLAFIFGTLLGLMAAFDVAAQYAGGDADGAAVNSLTQSVCGPLATDQNFFGGDGDGFASNTLSQSACPPLASDINFFGGNGDGFASNNLTQSTCPPLATDQNFFGGDGDGFSSNNLTQSACPPLAIDQNFFGGDGDGFASNSLSQSVCPPLAVDFNFFGGDGDGYSVNNLLQSLCPALPLGVNFYGGVGDGFATSVLTGCDPLPIELIEFNLSASDEGVLLFWATAVEINNDFFTVERSGLPIQFEPLTTIPGVGNRVGRTEYTYTDATPMPGMQYYRLKQTDYDGTFTYSPVKSIKVTEEARMKLQIYPNPAPAHKITFELTGGRPSALVVELKDQMGRKVYVGEIDYLPGRAHEFALPFSQRLTPGLYLLSVAGENEVLVGRVIVK